MAHPAANRAQIASRAVPFRTDHTVPAMGCHQVKVASRMRLASNT
jgi:hypothetical protein